MRWIWVMCLLAACGDNSTSGPVVRFSLPASGVPAPLAVPFPSDIYKEADGTLADGLTDWSLLGVDQPEPSALLSQFGAYDGFGVQAGVVFGIDGVPLGEGVDPATLDADHVLLVDADTGAKVPCLVGYDGFAHAITMVPEDVLVAGHRYAAGILAGPALTTGQLLEASSEFRSLRGDGDTGIYGDAIAALAAAGADRSQLLAATLFTTSKAHEKLVKTVARLFDGAYGTSPALNMGTVAAPFVVTRFGRTAHAGWTATLDQWLGTPRKAQNGTDLPGFADAPEPASTGVPHDALAVVMSGTIVAPWFPRAFHGTAALDDGTIAFDGAGNAMPADPTTQIPVLIALPIGPAPAGGFPVVIFQHGLGGQRRDALAIANELARSGIATVAVDGPIHGMRDPGAADAKSNGPGPFTGPDALADNGNPLIILDVFGRLRSALRARDLLWQFSIDLVALRRMIDVADLTAAADEYGGTPPTFDKQHVGLVGWSLGGLAAIEFSASTTNVDPVVFVSPASNLGTAFSGSPVYAAMSTLIAAAVNVRPPALDAGRYSAFLQVFESLANAGDDGAFLPLAANNHNVWFISAIEDESVPQPCADQVARALGATQLSPNVRAAARVPQAPSPLVAGASGKVTGWLEVSPGNHSHTFDRYSKLTFAPPYPRADEPRFVDLPAPISVRQTAVAEQRAISAFIRSVWSGAPRITIDDPALVPVADFDDDGFCDADESAAGTSPFDPTSKPSGAGRCVRDLGF